MSRNIIKYIAAFAMLIDHIGFLFVPIASPVGTAMRVIGRLTAPIMCYFICEGYIHTRSKKKYAIRLFLFALISQIPFAYMVNGYFWKLHFNVVATFFLCFMVLLVFEKVENLFLKLFIIVCLVCLCHYCDWGLMAPMWVLCFYLFKESKNKMAICYCLLCIFWCFRCCVVSYKGGGEWYDSLWQLGTLLALPIIYTYNGEKGRGGKFSKWFFYWFYPLHMLVLGIIFRM